MTTKVYVRKSGEAVISARVLRSLGIKPGTELEIDLHRPLVPVPAEFPPEIPPDKTVQDFPDEFEQKYHLKSEDFYEKWQRGETEDAPDINEWAGFYKTKLKLEQDGIDPSETTFKLFKKIKFEKEPA